MALTVALVSSDDAEAAMYEVELRYVDGADVKMAEGLNPVVFNFTVTNTGASPSMEVFVQLD